MLADIIDGAKPITENEISLSPILRKASVLSFMEGKLRYRTMNRSGIAESE
jgi:hypothetical protein